MTTVITIRKNGPIIIEGEVELREEQGSQNLANGRVRLALCRCGASARKPFCDGSHQRIGFCDDTPTPSQMSDGCIAR